MKLSQAVVDKALPQWSRCYYDYKTAKFLIKIPKRAALIIKKIQSHKVRQQNHQETNSVLVQTEGMIDGRVPALKKIVTEANIIFFKYHLTNKQVVQLFCQMKVHELDTKLTTYEIWSRYVDSSEKAYLQLLENLFYEAKILYGMCQLNIEIYNKLNKKHIKRFEKFKLDTPVVYNYRNHRTMSKLRLYFDKLQSIYLMKKQVYPKKARIQLRQQFQQNPTTTSIASYLFGVTNGISISLLVISIIIFNESNITIQNSEWKRDFPIWRAVGYLIFYIWIFALNIYIFDRLRINYKLIFGFREMSPTSPFLLTFASLFSFIYMLMFVLYTLDLADIIDFGTKAAKYFPLIAWGLIVFYMLLPLPILNHKGRLFFFKILLQMLVSPIIGVKFYTIWITQQLISFIEPVQDLIYGVCYYTRTNLQLKTDDLSCEQLLHTGQFFGIAIFTYRFLQCLRIGYRNEYFLCTNEMLIAIRALLNILILTLSYTASFDRRSIIAWYVVVGPIFMYSYFVDMKCDWGLLQQNQKHKFLRYSIAYNANLYYLLMVLNLIFRGAWVMTLSPNIVYIFDYSPYYFIFTVGMLEIVRRLFWNLIRMQYQHVQNVQNFRIKTDYHEKQRIVQEQIASHGEQIVREDPLQLRRRQQQLKNLRNYIQIKNQKKKILYQWLKQAQQKIQQIEKTLQND